MEQTNLVVTPDGKSWDEVTRDTSYINKNIAVNVSINGGNITGETNVIFNIHRGTHTHFGDATFKDDFALGYERFICLKTGKYKIYYRSAVNGNATSQNTYVYMRHNSAQRGIGEACGIPISNKFATIVMQQVMDLKRGDYIDFIAYWLKCDNVKYNNLIIERMRD